MFYLNLIPGHFVIKCFRDILGYAFKCTIIVDPYKVKVGFSIHISSITCETNYYIKQFINIYTYNNGQ